ncbi:MAG TPA: polymorphic toxin-type HINT domain-containing protein, partial [Kineosporiaceae bacterium]|nr:polymorphic toxin-type HINT domain-containing protein [Kineosporiaceae bacterium]
LLNLTDPTQWNPYTYSNNNPTTFSDPSGLYATYDPVHGGYTCFGSQGECNSPAPWEKGFAYGQVTPSDGGSPNWDWPRPRKRAPAGPVAHAAGQAAQSILDQVSGLLGMLGHPVETGKKYQAKMCPGVLECIYNYSPPGQLEMMGKGLWAPIGDRLDKGDTSGAIGYGIGTAIPFLFTRGLGSGLKADVAAADTEANAARLGAQVAKTCNSFAADTPVLMADGTTRPIKDVKLGDLVMAADPIIGERGPRMVVDLIRHSGLHAMVAVRLADGTVIDATDHHPFWAANRGEWVDAIALEAGDQVETVEGSRIAIVAVGIRVADLRAYNLTIADLHTYYAGVDRVLVHNAGGMNGCSDAAYQGVLHIRDEIEREGPGGSHSWAANMSDDALADYLDGFVARGGGQPFKGGGVGWYDAERGVAIIQRGEYSMSGYSMTYEEFLGKLK